MEERFRLWNMAALLLFAIAAGPWLASVYANNLSPHIVQQFLNDLCRQNNTVEGCKGISGQLPSSSTCKENEKTCPQQKARCFEKSFNCSNLDLNIVCNVAPDSRISVQQLFCGDGSRSGERCGTSKKKPVYSLVAAYCEGINDIYKPIGTSLGVVTEAGSRGGSGIYFCSEEGTWVPRHASPTIEELSISCRNAVCGAIPHPSHKFPVRRRWPVVRALKKKEAIHCSAAIVSQNAALTAAHCVTRSESSEQRDDPRNYDLEIPGPIKHSFIDTQIERIYLHPGYKYNNGAPIFDLAVIFFTSNQWLPTLCMATTPISYSHLTKEVIFNLAERKRFRNGQKVEELHWDVILGAKDTSCPRVSDRSALCEDVLPVGESQYCLKQEETSIQPGSSGGPHLIEIGNGVKETWTIKGILSRFSNESSCQQGRLIYIQLEEASPWLQKCVFDQQCQ